MKLLLTERSMRDSVEQAIMWADLHGWTPVHEAASTGNMEMMNLFVSAYVQPGSLRLLLAMLILPVTLPSAVAAVNFPLCLLLLQLLV